jgi:protein TonB
MFEQSLLGTTGRERGRWRWIAIGSVIIQVALLTAFVVGPLLYPATMAPYKTAEMKVISLAKVKPPVVVKRPIVQKTGAASAPASAQPVQMVARASTQTAITRPAIESDDKPTLLTGSGMGSPAGTLVGSGAFSGRGSDGSSPLVVVKAERRGPLNISKGVSAGLLLSPIRPVYPQIAKMAGVSGTVVVTATIDKSGRIVGLEVLSGPMMLQKAAADAVRDARYKPYLLNGEPVEVTTTFSVNFVMGAA